MWIFKSENSFVKETVGNFSLGGITEGVYVRMA